MMIKHEVLKRLLRRRVINDNGCWFFTGPSGGIKREICIDGRNQVIARISAWLYLDFNLESHALICHRCKSHGLCWNPDHIYIGDTSSNTKDSINDGTWTNQNKDKTHCINGHELSGNNLYEYKDKSGFNHRYCKACRNTKRHQGKVKVA